MVNELLAKDEKAIISYDFTKNCLETQSEEIKEFFFHDILTKNP